MVTQSNLQYLTGENKGYHSGHRDEDEDEVAGGQAAAPERSAEDQAAHFRSLTLLAQRVMRMKVRRMAVPQPTLAAELSAAGSPVVKVAIGYGHTVALCEDGSVWSKGYNDRGQLMQGHRITLPFFVAVPLALPGAEERVVDVQCGTSHTLLLTSAGAVYAAGGGGLGQLGQARRGDRLTPVRVAWGDTLYAPPGSNVAVSIGTGANHSCIVDATGALWTFGHSEYAQMAPPAALEEASKEAAAARGGSPASVGGRSSGSGPTGDHTVSARFYYEPRRMVGTGTGPGCVLQATRVFSGCGCNFMAATCADGRLMTWGWNAWNVLGRTANLAASRASGGKVCVPGFGEEVGLPVRSVACGQNHTVIVTEPEGHRFARGWDVLLSRPALRNKGDCLLIPLDAQGGLSGDGPISVHSGVLAARCPVLLDLLQRAAQGEVAPSPSKAGGDSMSLVLLPLLPSAWINGESTVGQVGVRRGGAPPVNESDPPGWLQAVVDAYMAKTTTTHTTRVTSGAGGVALELSPPPAGRGGAASAFGSPGASHTAPFAKRLELSQDSTENTSPPRAAVVFQRTGSRVLRSLVAYLYCDKLQCTAHHLPQLLTLVSSLRLTRLVGLVERAMCSAGGEGAFSADDVALSGGDAVQAMGSHKLHDVAAGAAAAAREFFASRARKAVAKMDAKRDAGGYVSGNAPVVKTRREPSRGVRSAARGGAARDSLAVAADLASKGAEVARRISAEMVAVPMPAVPASLGADPPAGGHAVSVAKQVKGGSKELLDQPTPASRWILDMRQSLMFGLFPDLRIQVVPPSSGSPCGATDEETEQPEHFFAHSAVLQRYEFFDVMLSGRYGDVQKLLEGPSPPGVQARHTPKGVKGGNTIAGMVHSSSAPGMHQIMLHGVFPSVFRFVLDWMYTGDKALITGDSCLPLLATAAQLGVADLQAAAEAVACEHCDVDSAAMLLEFGHDFGIPRLQSHAAAVLQVPLTA